MYFHHPQLQFYICSAVWYETLKNHTTQQRNSQHKKLLNTYIPTSSKSTLWLTVWETNISLYPKMPSTYLVNVKCIDITVVLPVHFYWYFLKWQVMCQARKIYDLLGPHIPNKLCTKYYINQWYGAGVFIHLERGEVQMICIWSSWCHHHHIMSCFSKIQMVYLSIAGLSRLSWKKGH